MITHLAPARRRRTAAALLTFTTAAALVLAVGRPASAGIVKSVPLATSGNYAVLGGTTVTNTNDTVLNNSLGLSPGPEITGFPPGLVVPPATTDETNAAAAQAQSDLTTAYLNAKARPNPTTTTSDLAGRNLSAGVYAGEDKAALELTGPLVLNGQNDPSSVFIFQTDSTLITGSGSTVSLINGAQECNVFWQVGSSATLGTGSVFVGNILALTSITVTSSVTVHGRALARNGAVTLDNDTFTKPTCATSNGADGGSSTIPGGGSVTTASAGGTVTTVRGGSTVTTTRGDSTATTRPGGGTGTTTPGNGTGTTVPGGDTTTGVPGGPGMPPVEGPPRTGGAPWQTASFSSMTLLLAGLCVAVAAISRAVRRREHARFAQPAAP
jgi:hypothetical protein